MRIGIEAQRLFRPDKHGMEIVTQELIKQLQLVDQQNEYVLFIKPDCDIVISETPNFHIEYLKGSYPVWEQIRLPRALRNQHIDFLHCTSNTGPLYTKIPVMLTLHDIIYLEQVEFKGSAYQNFGNLYRRSVVPGLLKKCRYILTVSEYEKQVIAEKLPFSRDHLHVVYNGVNPVFRLIDQAYLKDNISEKYKLPENFYLFFGNTAPKKNTERLILGYAAACLEYPGLGDLVITDYSEELIHKLLHEPKYLPVLRKICVLGHIPHEEIPVFYNLAKIFLYPSIRESFGMPIIEAMACGTPVITSNTSSMPEVAADAAELIDPFSIEEITMAILKLDSNTKLYAERIEAGLIRSRFFSWEKTALSVLEFYKKMAN